MVVPPDPTPSVEYWEPKGSDLKYNIILNDLKRQIEDGTLQPGDLLPSENTLTASYDVSRMSVRKALSILSEKGYIYTSPGRGSFVSKPVTDQYTLVFDEKKMMSAISDRIHLHSIEIIDAAKVDSERIRSMGLNKLISIKRVFLSDGTPVAYEKKYIVYDKGKPFVEEELRYATLPDIVAKKASLFAVRKELKIWSQLATEAEQDILYVTGQQPLTVVERNWADSDNVPLVFSRLYVKSDKIKLIAYSV